MTSVWEFVVILCMIALTNAGPYEEWLTSARDPSILQDISPQRRTHIDNYYRDYYNSYYGQSGLFRSGLVPPPNPSTVVEAPQPPSRISRLSPAQQRRYNERVSRRTSLRTRFRQRLGLPEPAAPPPLARAPAPLRPAPILRTLRPSTPILRVPAGPVPVAGPPLVPPQVRRSGFWPRIGAVPAAVQQPIPAGPAAERANVKVAACCRGDSNIPSQCYNLCNFDNFNRRTLTQAYLRKTCPVAAAHPVLSCASGNVDHSRCCSQSGVRGICLNFCTPGIPKDVGNQYLKCLRDLNAIKTCFRQYHNTTP